MNARQQKAVLERLAVRLVPDDVDVWHAIQARWEMSHSSTQKGETSMNAKIIQSRRRNRQVRQSIAWVAVLVALAALFLITPAGRAWAQEIIHFFTRAGRDALPLQPWQLTPAPTPATPSQSDPANILEAEGSVRDVEAQAGFHVLEPTWLPETLSFKGATFEGQQGITRLFYTYAESNGLVLRQEAVARTEDCELCGQVGASAAIETVDVNGARGEYVEGVWNLTDEGPVWVPDPYLKTLRWQTNGVALELLYMGPPDSVSKEDLLHVAQSLK